MNSNSKIVYLTFDDGPIPGITPWVLETLRKFNARATFFCVGENVLSHPDILKQIIEEGHVVGNHTMHHVNAWKTSNEKYWEEIISCDRLLQVPYFRPPYGKLRLTQIKRIKKKFRIVMWDVLSKDYDPRLTGKECFENIKRSAGNGSIIVLHDSAKAEERLRYALPETLKYFTELGYNFKSIC